MQAIGAAIPKAMHTPLQRRLQGGRGRRCIPLSIRCGRRRRELWFLSCVCELHEHVKGARLLELLDVAVEPHRADVGVACCLCLGQRVVRRHPPQRIVWIALVFGSGNHRRAAKSSRSERTTSGKKQAVERGKRAWRTDWYVWEAGSSCRSRRRRPERAEEQNVMAN